ncbi:glycosyltransferase [Mucilaginibacter sp. KACC 22063]|uniref:glycosyltransferase n=1 Tax=Mucilaginibacter sp. KACC 22063 TaxID=3025666 RepID=UPI00236517A3|nr:glycosyltransferase [Mucilaginibacter sp. KACC 22063]WDF57139.1 glycosyltransferase [Mucilaginibacter sp. KACC 22063]
MTKPKVLHISTGLDRGGAEKVILDLSTYLMQNDFEVHVIGLTDKDKFKDAFEQQGITINTLNITKSPLSLIEGLSTARKFIKKHDIKLIHAHMTHALIFASLLKLLLPSINIVFTPHSFNIGSSLRFAIVRFLKPLRKADILFSAKMKRSCYKKQSYIIPNGIDTAKYDVSYPKNQRFTFVTIGRLERVKNHSALIECAAMLKGQFDFEIQLVGDGILREDLQKAALDKGVADILKFCGYQSNVAEICSRAHVFLLPSLWEGFPISLLEAGASGIPVLSTPVGSIPEVIGKEYGYLAEIIDFPVVMHEMYKNYQEALSKAELFRSVVQQKYDLKIIGKRHTNIYLQLIQGHALL